MTQMTALQIAQLNKADEAHRRAAIGTRIAAMEFGTAVVPGAGSLLSSPILHYNISTAALGTATKVLAATLLVQTVTKTVTTGITNPDFPRLLSVKGNDGNVTGNVVITGTDINDAVLTETIALNAASEVTGTKAFKTVNTIVLPPYDTAGTETVSVGFMNKLGMPIALSNTALVIAKNFNGSVDAGTLTPGATAALTVYAPAGTLDGAKDIDLWFVAA